MSRSLSTVPSAGAVAAMSGNAARRAAGTRAPALSAFASSPPALGRSRDWRGFATTTLRPRSCRDCRRARCIRPVASGTARAAFPSPGGGRPCGSRPCRRWRSRPARPGGCSGCSCSRRRRQLPWSCLPLLSSRRSGSRTRRPSGRGEDGGRTGRPRCPTDPLARPGSCRSGQPCGARPRTAAARPGGGVPDPASTGKAPGGKGRPFHRKSPPACPRPPPLVIAGSLDMRGRSPTGGRRAADSAHLPSEPPPAAPERPPQGGCAREGRPRTG